MILYQKKEKIFPSYIDIDGKLYLINADFRNILRIFAILKDMKVPEDKRVEKLAAWFFVDVENIKLPYDTAIKSFLDFINPTHPSRRAEGVAPYEEQETERQFCYDFDAEEIYAGFLSEYGIDLVEAEFLHWYKFKILLGNLSGESAFKKKIELRFMDLSHFTGKSLADMAKTKESVQLPIEYSDDELREINEFEGVWGRL